MIILKLNQNENTISDTLSVLKWFPHATMQTYSVYLPPYPFFFRFSMHTNKYMIISYNVVFIDSQRQIKATIQKQIVLYMLNTFLFCF